MLTGCLYLRARSLARSQLHDHVQGNHSWPDLYDGRAIVHPSYRDHLAGVPLADNAAQFQAAKESGDSSRMVTWSYVCPLSFPFPFPSPIYSLSIPLSHHCLSVCLSVRVYSAFPNFC